MREPLARCKKARVVKMKWETRAVASTSPICELAQSQEVMTVEVGKRSDSRNVHAKERGSIKWHAVREGGVG